MHFILRMRVAYRIESDDSIQTEQNEAIQAAHARSSELRPAPYILP